MFLVECERVNEAAVGSLRGRAEVEYPHNLRELVNRQPEFKRERLHTMTMDKRINPAAAACLEACG